MMKYEYIYPFVALVGQDDLKEALAIALTNPQVGGLLISGTKATGKSTALRAAMAMSGRRLVELPLSATEDRVFGHIDIEKTLADGERVFAPGLLADADGAVLYVDEINLLRRDLLAGVLQVHDVKENRVEREGVSYRHPTEFLLVGSMNPEEGTLSEALLDRFGLFVQAEPLAEPAARAEIARRVLAYEQDRVGFVAAYAEATEELRRQWAEARERVARIELPEAMLTLAATYSEKAGIAGHRGDIILLEAAKAIAALAGRTFLIPDDMERAAYFVLPHRMRQPAQQSQPEPPPPAPPEEPSEQPESDDTDTPEPPQDTEPDAPAPEPPPQGDTDDHEDTETEDEQEPPEMSGAVLPPEAWEDIDKAFAALQMQVRLQPDRFKRRGSGKRQRTKTDLRQGRYIRAVPMGREVTDLALDATIRAAAPYQRMRQSKGLAISLERDDLRRKVREKRTGSVFLFCVDASGSMGARHRMGAVKGAIYGLLQDAYQKRDRVGMISFRRSSAEVLLPVTRSIDLAQKLLRDLSTGGKTPLAAGLERSLAVLAQLRYQDPQVRPIFILVTDGRATAALSGGNPVEEALTLAAKFRHSGATCVVIDTETDFISMQIARRVAQAMGATYHHIRTLTEAKVLQIMQEYH